MTSTMLTIVNGMLPTSREEHYSFIGRATGALHAHPWLTKLSDHAALRNNEA